MRKIGILFIALMIGTHSFSDSILRVNNNSIFDVQAIWQAGGCVDIVKDWEGDSQFTTCSVETFSKGEGGNYRFAFIYSDRSMKLFTEEHGLIGYCNSMDDGSITVENDSDGKLIIEKDCP